MKDGRYRHCNWSLIVEIKDNCIVEFIHEPFMSTENLWHVVRKTWFLMMNDKRPITEDEEDYFIYDGD